MASAADAIDQSSDDDGPKQIDPNTGQEAHLKRKKFQPFKAMKKFFSIKKKPHKSKDESGAPMSKSTSELHAVIHREKEHAAASGRLSGNLSLSADSVFTAEKGRDPQMEAAKSMEVLPQRALKNELFQKIKGRRADADDESADELGSNQQSMSLDSDNSLLSMDSSENELDAEFFGGSDLRPGTPEGVLSTDLDLNAVTKTKALSNAAARHKISIKPRNKRSSTAFNKRHTVAVLDKPSDLEEVKEEPAPNESVEEPPKKKDKDNTETKKPPVQALFVEKPEEKEVKANPKPPVSPKPVKKVIEDTSKATSPTEGVVLRKKSIPTSPTEPSVDDSAIKRRENFTKQDPSKRQTIAGGVSAAISMFGDRKVSKRSSGYEVTDWDNLERPKSASPPPAEESGNSEFAQMFSKMRKVSQKRMQFEKSPEPKENTEVRKSSVGNKKSPQEKESKPIVTSPTQATPTATTAKKEEKAKTDSLPRDKPKPVVVEEKPKTLPLKEDKEKAEAKTPETTKETKIEESPKDPSQSDSPYKRQSPMMKDRGRSKTLPEQPVSKPEVESSPSSKTTSPPTRRTAAEDEAAKESTSTASNKSGASALPNRKPVVKSNSMVRAIPKKILVADSEGGNVPPWVALAQKRQKEQEEKKSNVKDKKDNSNESVKKGSSEVEKKSNSEKTSESAVKKASTGSQPKMVVIENKESTATKDTKTTTAGSRVSTLSTASSASSASSTSSKTAASSTSKPAASKSPASSTASVARTPSNAGKPSTSSASKTTNSSVNRSPSSAGKTTPTSEASKTPSSTTSSASKTAGSEAGSAPSGSVKQVNIVIEDKDGKKEESTPPEKCSNSASARKSKVLDMVKNFQKLQVS